MSRASVFYITTFAAFILGLWAVLKIGGHLQASPDLRGQWELVWDTPSGDGLPRTLSISQSGRYIDLQWNNAVTLGQLKFLEDAGGYEGEFHPSRQGWRMNISVGRGSPTVTSFTGVVAGPTSQPTHFVARPVAAAVTSPATSH